MRSNLNNDVAKPVNTTVCLFSETNGAHSYLSRLIRSRARPCIMLISSLGMVTSSYSNLMNSTWSSLLNLRPYKRMYLKHSLRFENHYSSNKHPNSYLGSQPKSELDYILVKPTSSKCGTFWTGCCKNVCIVVNMAKYQWTESGSNPKWIFHLS